MDTNIETIPPDGENLAAWRLGRLEKAVEQVDSKIDGFNAVKENVLINQEKIRSLEKSRDRMIAALSGLSVGFVLLAVEAIFGAVK